MNRLCKNEVKYVKMLTKIFTLHTCILVQTSVSRSNKRNDKCNTSIIKNHNRFQNGFPAAAFFKR